MATGMERVNHQVIAACIVANFWRDGATIFRLYRLSRGHLHHCVGGIPMQTARKPLNRSCAAVLTNIVLLS